MDARNLTLDEIKRLQSERWQELIDYVGSVKHLSFMLDVPEPTAINWSARKRISRAAAIKVEEHPTLGGKFTAIYLRPDLACK